MEQPVYFWTPDIAPAGIGFYTGKLFPAWQGDLFVCELAGKSLVRLVLKDERVIAEERPLTELEAESAASPKDPTAHSTSSPIGTTPRSCGWCRRSNPDRGLLQPQRDNESSHIDLCVNGEHVTMIPACQRKPGRPACPPHATAASSSSFRASRSD